MADDRAWTTVRTLRVRVGTFDPALPVAGFDLDSTLRPHKGRGRPESFTRRFLVLLARSGFNVVIVTNRSADTSAAKLAEAMVPVREYVDALDADMADAGVPASVTVYATTSRDRDRKPHTGAWEHYQLVVAGGAPIWWAFFCGDAAGRPGDHSSDDYAFALNCGIDFTTPEALFQGGSDPWAAVAGCAAPIPDLGAPGDSAAPLIAALGLKDATSEFLDRTLLGAAQRRICVIMVGSPASGKSRVADRLRREHHFAVVSRDQYGAAFERRFRELLAAADGSLITWTTRVAVDNTNPSAEERGRLAATARRFGFEVFIAWATTPRDVCFHLNGARCQLGGREVPPIAIHTYWKRLAPPTENEAAAAGATLVCLPFALAANAPPEVTRFHYATR